MKKFEEELFSKVPCKFGLSTEGEYRQSILVKHFGDWVSPEDHQNTVASNKAYETSNLRMSKENAKFVGENIELTKQIAELKSQLEKQQPDIPKVPPFMGEWFKSDNLENLIDTWYNHTADLPENVKDYLDSLGEDVTASEYCYKEIVHLIARAKLDGYTVAKEKKYLLKHKSLVIYDGEGKEPDVDELYLNAEGNFTIFPYNAKIFTQSEIDSMNTESYEKIEVDK